MSAEMTPEQQLAIAKSVLATLVSSTTLARSTTMAGFVICVYDCWISMDREVVLFWLRPWSFAKGLYLFNRYMVMFLLGFHMVMFFVDSNLTPEFCMAWFKSEASTGIVAIIAMECVLAFRVYALWEQSKIILGILVGALICQAAAMGTVLGITYLTMTALVEPIPGVDFHACIPQNVNPYFFAYWFPPLAFETLAFILALIRGFRSFRLSANQTGANLMSILMRDSALYFIVVISIDLTSALLWTKGPPELLQAIVGPCLALPSCLGARLLLNLREASYQPMANVESIEMPRYVSGKSGWNTTNRMDTDSKNSSFLPGSKRQNSHGFVTSNPHNISINVSTQVEKYEEEIYLPEKEDQYRHTYTKPVPGQGVPRAF